MFLGLSRFIRKLFSTGVAKGSFLMSSKIFSQMRADFTVWLWPFLSVVGLSLDYMAYNITGFLFYSIYCISKFIYQHNHPAVSKSVDPNDIAFAVHALLLVIVQISQCFIYEVSSSLSWC